MCKIYVSNLILWFFYNLLANTRGERDQHKLTNLFAGLVISAAYKARFFMLTRLNLGKNQINALTLNK